MDEGIGEAEALAVAFAEAADHLAGDILEGGEVHDAAHVFLHGAPAEAFESGAEFEVFLDAHVVVERDAFRHVADLAAGFEGVGENVMAGDAGGAAAGREVAGEHAHGGGFAGAVGSEKADDFAFSDAEGNVVHGGAADESFREVADFDHGSALAAECAGPQAAMPRGGRGFNLSRGGRASNDAA